MNIERRLRGAFSAAAQTVRPETVRPCPDPPVRLRHRWILWMTPLAAAAATAVIIVAVTLGTSVFLRGHQHASAPEQPAQRVNPPVRPSSGHAPPGPIVQQRVKGQTAQRVDRFWFGLSGGEFCLRVMPLPDVGPSWTFQDRSHDCVSFPPNGTTQWGTATGGVSEDGVPGSFVQFTAVYGVLQRQARKVDVVWSDHLVSTVAVTSHRFFLVWAGTQRPALIEVKDQAGLIIARHASKP